MTIFMPTGALAAQLQPIACVGSPALVGCMTALNPSGVAMGVDVVQAALVSEGRRNCMVTGLWGRYWTYLFSLSFLACLFACCLQANTTVVGMNSLLMVRATIEDPHTTSSETAVRYIAGATRGVPWCVSGVA